MASLTKNVGYLTKWIRRSPVRSGKLSNVGPAGSILLEQKFRKVFCRSKFLFEPVGPNVA